MDVTFSDRVSLLKPSAIREIFKVTSLPGVISFAAGNPAPETFPSAEMGEIAARIFRDNPASALQYGITEGYFPLISKVSDRLKNKYHLGCDFDRVLITSGGQQGIELFSKVILNEGDTVICENPSFIGALNAFRSYRANLIGIPMDDCGIDLEKLEHTLKNTKNVKFIYLIPTFQNPSGKTMPVSRRKSVLELAEKYDVMIIEDNPYFELRYSGDYVPPIKSFDEKGRVIYIGSFSKVLSPGMRVGFTLASSDIIEKMVVAKQVSDVHTNLFFQMVVSEYLEKHDIDAHIGDICSIYREKRDAMMNSLTLKMDKRIKTVRPEGGLFLWCEMPQGYDGLELCRLAGQRKVAAVPGSAFMADESKICPAVRLNFSLPTIEQIERGISVLAEAASDYLENYLEKGRNI